jgi:hypothetical protein
MRGHIKGDPHWIRVKWACVCDSCGCAIKRGEQAFFFPRGSVEHRMYCSGVCGQTRSSQFESEAQDEYLNSIIHAM